MTADNLQIILVRHGQTDSNKLHILQGQVDTPLNDVGRLQATAGGNRLATEGIDLDAVWSSDLIRCKETAELILAQADRSHLQIVFQADLRERAMGELEGMSIVEARFKARNDGKAFHDYGEPKKVSIKRLNKAFDKIVDESIEKGHKKVMIVSHGGESHVLPPAAGLCPDPLFLASLGIADTTNMLPQASLPGSVTISYAKKGTRFQIT